MVIMEENKQLDHFIRKSIKEVGLEEPSIDFTEAVMSKLAIAHQKDPVFVAKPLLSKTIWFLIWAAVAAIFAFVIFSDSTVESTGLVSKQLHQLTSFNLAINVPKFSFSDAFIYGSMAIALCVWFQVFLIRNKLAKGYVSG